MFSYTIIKNKECKLFNKSLGHGATLENPIKLQLYVFMYILVYKAFGVYFKH